MTDVTCPICGKYKFEEGYDLRGLLKTPKAVIVSEAIQEYDRINVFMDCLVDTLLAMTGFWKSPYARYVIGNTINYGKTIRLMRRRE